MSQPANNTSLLPSGSEEVTVQLADLDDMDMLADIGEAFFTESGYGQFMEYRADHTAQFLRALIFQGGFVVKATVEPKEPGDPAALIGMAACVLRPMYLNHEAMAAQELFWWVTPRWRKSGCAVGTNILHFMEAEARARGAELMVMMCLDALGGDQVGKLFKKNGYSPTERTWMKRLGTEH